MQTTTNPQLGLLDALMASVPSNKLLERLNNLLDWEPIEVALWSMYPAKTGRPPHPPLVLFKMCLLQHCYNLSDPQCEELLCDRISWRKFCGLGLQDPVPDETTLVRFRQRLMEHGLHETLLELINKQLEAQGVILKTCTLVDATLVQAARRPPSKPSEEGGDPDASFTVKGGRPHYGYKAHVAVDQTHTMIRRVRLTGAHVHDSQEFKELVQGDEQMVVADKAYWSREHCEWCAEHGVANGIMERGRRGHKLRAGVRAWNLVLGRLRARVEGVFGWMKQWAGYRRGRYQGLDPNRLELEFKSICWNLIRLVKVAAA